METGEPVQAGIWVQQRGAQAGQVLVEFACQPVRDAGGAVAGVLLYAADASAHVRDRNRLEVLAGDLAASEERYRTLFETMPQGIVHYDADGSVIGANRAAGEILGIDLTTVTSWPVVPEGQTVHEDGSLFPPGELPVLAALRTGEIVADAVAGVRHGKTGELRWVRITAVPDARDEQGKPSRAYAIFTDLTEQRRTEAALRQSTALLGPAQGGQRARRRGPRRAPGLRGERRLPRHHRLQPRRPGGRPHRLAADHPAGVGRRAGEGLRAVAAAPGHASRSRRSTCTGTGTGCPS